MEDKYKNRCTCSHLQAIHAKDGCKGRVQNHFAPCTCKEFRLSKQ